MMNIFSNREEQRDNYEQRKEESTETLSTGTFSCSQG